MYGRIYGKKRTTKHIVANINIGSILRQKIDILVAVCLTVHDKLIIALPVRSKSKH